MNSNLIQKAINKYSYKNASFDKNAKKYLLTISDNIIKFFVVNVEKSRNLIDQKDIRDLVNKKVDINISRHVFSEFNKIFIKLINMYNVGKLEDLSLNNIKNALKNSVINIDFDLLSKKINKYFKSDLKLNKLLADDIKKGKKLRSYMKKPINDLLAADIKKGKKLKKSKKIKKVRSFCKQPPDYFCNLKTLRWNLLSKKKNKLNFGKHSFNFGYYNQFTSSAILYIAVFIDYILEDIIDIVSRSVEEEEITLKILKNIIKNTDLDNFIKMIFK